MYKTPRVFLFFKTQTITSKGTIEPYCAESAVKHESTNYLSIGDTAARGDLVVPRTRLQLGNWAFCVAGPVAWNSLPLDIRSAPTLLTFKNMLKTHLFSRSYFTD